ncbi:MAG: hypothetical protein HY747_09640 [Elusimicrobia bacterium]|nr:hypothetical protein [Elusimicrobiota bacterium]
MGLKTELLDSKDSFHKSSRIHVDGMPVDLFFTMLVANFCKFHTNYPPKETGACNFAEIQMPIKFFRFYLEELGHGG